MLHLDLSLFCLNGVMMNSHRTLQNAMPSLLRHSSLPWHSRTGRWFSFLTARLQAKQLRAGARTRYKVSLRPCARLTCSASAFATWQTSMSMYLGIKGYLVMN